MFGRNNQAHPSNTTVFAKLPVLAPTVIHVFYNNASAAVNHFHDVALSVAEIAADTARAGAFLCKLHKASPHIP